MVVVIFTGGRVVVATMFGMTVGCVAIDEGASGGGVWTVLAVEFFPPAFSMLEGSGCGVFGSV